VDLAVASEIRSSFESKNPSGLVTLDLDHVERAVDGAMAFHAQYPLDAAFGIDDRTAVVAAAIAERLGLMHNSVDSVRAAGDKGIQRRRLSEARVPVPRFLEVTVDHAASDVAPLVAYPCVVKPVSLSGSRGVIRASNASEFVSAFERVCSISGPECRRLLVEDFVPGREFAVEGLLVHGSLHVLALFDKPDTMDGPFFEETIYVTPSREPLPVQRAVVKCVRESAFALGLTHGPIHAEVRYGDGGAWLIELAARPIGGRCSAALSFGPGTVSLEDVLLRHALGELGEIPDLAPGASGVMMIPTPAAGVLEGWGGADEARRIPGIVGVIVTAPRGQRLTPLPEGSRYLGFIFARDSRPAQVERALRAAHAKMSFDVR
jgi:biotin carboxylase